MTSLKCGGDPIDNIGGGGVKDGSNIAYVIYEQPLKLEIYISIFFLYICLAIFKAPPPS